jgi:hypothetical protein
MPDLFPRRDEIDIWLRSRDGPNCLLIAVQSPIEVSHFVEVGVNVAIAFCHTDTLAGVFLSYLPQVVSSRRGLVIEGTLSKNGISIPEIVYRSVLRWRGSFASCSRACTPASTRPVPVRGRLFLVTTGKSGRGDFRGLEDLWSRHAGPRVRIHFPPAGSPVRT